MQMGAVAKISEFVFADLRFGQRPTSRVNIVPPILSHGRLGLPGFIHACDGG